MESRTYKDNFRNLILDMVQQELENYVSQRGAKKYFETNVDVEKLKVYTSSEPGSWLRQETTSRSAASETHEVSLHATSNKGGMSRSAYLLFVKEEDGSQKELATVKISQQGGQVLESVDFSEDGKIDTLQQHVKGEGIPIVLMGDGFVDQELADGTYRRVMEEPLW